MKKTALMSAIFGAISLCNMSMVAAEVPDNIVLIGDKAFDLDYANNKENVKEIMGEVKKNSERIFIKANNNWFSNETSKKIIEEPSACFNYKDDFYVLEDQLKIEELDIKNNLYILSDRAKLINIKVKNKIIIDEKIKQVTLNGKYSRINVQPNKAEIIIENGNIEEISVEGDCTLNLGKEGNIERLIINGNDVKIQGEGKNNIKKIYEEKSISTKDEEVYGDKSVIEVKADKEKDFEDIINLHIKGRGMEDLYGIQMNINYDTSSLIIEDIFVDEKLNDKLNIEFKDYNGSASCIAFLTGNVKGLNIDDELIKIRIRLLNKKTLNLSNSDGDLKFNFKLSNSKGKEIKIDNIKIDE